MAIEIEIKARVDDPGAVRERLAALGEFICFFEKNDVYWFPPAGGGSLPPSGLRIRETARSGDRGWDGKDPGAEGSPAKTTQVTYKTREIRDGMEINDEREFSVSDKTAFSELLVRLGFKPGITKTKRGWCWKYGDITAELALVKGLGWFVELEILADNDRPETTAAARRLLLDCLEKTGLGTDRIEARYYTEMLGSRLSLKTEVLQPPSRFTVSPPDGAAGR